MRRNLTKLFTALLFLAIGWSAQAQSSAPPAHKFDTYIAAVYTGSGANFIKPDSRRYSYFKDLYENRIRFVKNDAEKLSQDRNLKKLSQVEMYSVYNKSLMRDVSFDANSFNPFKYNLDFYSSQKLVYWIDGTDYLLIITPQERNY